MHHELVIKGARLHNLKNVTVRIPKNKFVVLTGLSGSGKSTLAFDVLHKEGQRQYLESMGMVTDYLSRPNIDGIEGLSPSISVDQHLTNRSPRSTVGTETEIYTYLRILFAKIGHRPCPRCKGDVPPPHGLNDDHDFMDDGAGEGDANTYPCPHCGERVVELTMTHFSFNKLDGACPTCTGLGVTQGVDLSLLVDERRSIVGGAVLAWDEYYIARNTETLTMAGKHFGFPFDVEQPVREYGPIQRDLLLYGVESSIFRRHFPGIEPPQTARKGRFEGIITNFLRRYAERIEDQKYREKMERYVVQQVCPDCRGDRLRPESRAVTVFGKTIIELSREPLTDLARWLEALPGAIDGEERAITQPILDDLHERVQRVIRTGVGYLTLERPSPSLSAGEAQRLRLAALLGSGLSGVIYVLDEPTMGLHQGDTGLLVEILRRLRDLGNTVIVIEHDMELVRAADYVIDMGPGAGQHGGQVVAAGPPADLPAFDQSLTGQFLSGRRSIAIPEGRRAGNGQFVTVYGARANNLKDLTVRIPLGKLVAVTGVSGSGKSSLVFDILDRAARRRYFNAGEAPGEHDRIEGWEQIEKVITLNQAAIGRTPRSNAATYTDVFGPMRRLFASTEEARQRGLTDHHFSFNVPGGRCEKCKGAGVVTVSMHFLPDVQVRCPSCHGRRFRREVLEVTWGGCTVADILNMTIAEAADLFHDVPPVRSRLGVMQECGLGYLGLGQPATTLSGGEAQRVKLAKELGRRSGGRTLYLLDEPTTGLHPADVANLLKVLQGLVDAGNSVVVVEHNLDLVKVTDWVIDLGPAGGLAGGYLLAEGTPEAVATAGGSRTGQCLRNLL
ncbi:MAG: excinuclease ABC subunit UvrA [Bacillota bacterium]